MNKAEKHMWLPHDHTNWTVCTRNVFYNSPEENRTERVNSNQNGELQQPKLDKS